MLKVLHTGDLHLGMTHNTRKYPENVRQQLVEARFMALEKMVETANQEGCQLLLIAGDMFHNIHVQKTIVTKAVQILKLFAGSCVAVLPGNHDFFHVLVDVWKYFRDEAPEHILLLTETKPYDLQAYGLDAVLYPAPCHQKHSTENQLGWIKALGEKPQRKWHLGVAHGTVRGISPDFDGRYFPMERDELLLFGLDHWCLGHTHNRYPDVFNIANCGFAYCGTPEPDGFDCGHAGFAWLLTLQEDSGVHLQALQIGTYQFIELSLQVNNLAEIKTALAAVAGETSLVKFNAAGRLSHDEFRYRSDFFYKEAQNVAYLEYDDTLLLMEISAQSIDAEFPAGSFPHLFLSALAAKDDNEALQLAYELVKKVKKC